MTKKIIETIQNKIINFMSNYINKTFTEIIIMYFKRIGTILLIFIPLLFLKYENKKDFSTVLNHFIAPYSSWYYPLVIVLNFWEPVLALFFKLLKEPRRKILVENIKKIKINIEKLPFFLKLFISLLLLIPLIFIAHLKCNLIKSFVIVTFSLLKLYGLVVLISILIVAVLVYVIIPISDYIINTYKSTKK